MPPIIIADHLTKNFKIEKKEPGLKGVLSEFWVN